MKDIESTFIDSLVEEYGSPLFVVSAEVLKNNVRTFKKAFSAKYPRVEVAYAYKANYLSEVLKVIHKEGAWAEVASYFEYDIARGLGVSGKLIVFNGPGKTEGHLTKAISEGVLVNVDNEDEIKLLSEISSKQNRPIDVGIRINADVGINQRFDRFGFNLENREAFKIVKQCAESDFLNVVCLHVHLTSYIVEPSVKDEYIPAQNIKLIWPKSADMYEIAAKKISRFAREIESKLGIRIKYIDLGGGFPSVDGLGPYVSKVIKPIISEFEEELPVLILEPGRAIVKNAAFLVATVLASKEFQNGQRAVTVDAGVNILPTSYWTLQDVRPLKTYRKRKLRDTVIYGPLCLQTDVVAKTLMEELETGDKIVVENVGAYNLPQASTFIYPRPQVVMLEGGSVRVIRRSETVDDVLKLED